MSAAKASPRDLAIVNGIPAFIEALHVNRPTVSNRKGFVRRLNSSLDSRWLTNNGPHVRELEEQLARYLRVRNCVTTSNGTVALQLVLKALDISGEVIVPSFTFISAAHALRWLGITPVFCDVDLSSQNLDPACCESLITEKTQAIIGVHLWGRACDTDALESIAEARRVRLLFDAAHAFGCAHKGRMIGAFGDAEVFSFHATKVFHTFEGGAITTDNDDLATRLRQIRNFGFVDYDKVDGLGINAKLPESSAAMGLANLEVIDRILEKNKRTHDEYRNCLDGIPGLTIHPYGEEQHNHHYVVLNVDEERLGVSRDHLMGVLHAENILARRYFYPGCHRMEPYASLDPSVDSRLPNTNIAASQVLVLPGGDLSIGDVRLVSDVLRLAVNGGDSLPIASNGKPRDKTHSSSRPEAATSVCSDPSLEFRIPVSPNDTDMRSVRYFLESVQEFGGPIARNSHCVLSVGADEEPFDLKSAYPWLTEYSVDVRWVDRDLFRQWTYDATGFDRFWVDSEADVVALIDADLLVAGDLDQIVRDAYRGGHMLGFISHLSPFAFAALRDTSSEVWWQRLYDQAGLEAPALDWEVSGWGLDWKSLFPKLPILTQDPRHRYCPPYFNYGFIIGRRRFWEKVGETFIQELEAVESVLKSIYRSQIANCLAFQRHGIPCRTLSVNYNFPLNLPGGTFRSLHPDPDGENRHEDTRIFHYIGGRENFASADAVEELTNRTDLSGAWAVFQQRLRTVSERIAESAVVSSSEALSG